MTTMEWEHLVRDVLPRVKAARMLESADTASVPHMTKEGREGVVQAWTTAAVTQFRLVSKEVGSQLASFRRFLASHGIDPDSGGVGTNLGG